MKKKDCFIMVFTVLGSLHFFVLDMKYYDVCKDIQTLEAAESLYDKTYDIYSMGFSGDVQWDKKYKVKQILYRTFDK